MVRAPPCTFKRTARPSPVNIYAWTGERTTTREDAKQREEGRKVLPPLRAPAPAAALAAPRPVAYPSPTMSPKQRAAEAALKHVRDGMVVGLGTGSTADLFLQALAGALKDGRLRDIRGVPTSRQSERRAEHLGIPLATLADCPRPDVTIDGADEVAPNLDLIKGLGGALLREKIVAQNSKKLVIIADAGKAVAKPGTKSPLPVEVAMFEHEANARFLKALGCDPALRK